MANDLIPLLLMNVEKENFKMAIAACTLHLHDNYSLSLIGEIMVPLTWPITDQTKTIELDRLRTYKRCFLQPGVWKAIVRLILHLSSTPYG